MAELDGDRGAGVEPVLTGEIVEHGTPDSPSSALGTRYSALAQSPAPDPQIAALIPRRGGLLGLVTGRISSKIIGPYLLIMLLMAVLGTFVVLRLVSGSLEQRFTNQLFDAGKAVNDTVIKIEQEQLELQRLMAATTGVDAAIIKNDPLALQKLLVPLEANSHYTIVDVVDARGREILALRPSSGPLARAIDPNINQWEVTKKSVAGVADEFGDKYSDLVFTSFGPLLYTGSPVKDGNGKVVGAVLVGLPLNDLLSRLTKDVQASVTIYGPDGWPIGTAFDSSKGAPSLYVDPQTYRKATGQPAASKNGTAGGQSEQVIQRTLKAGSQQYMELVGALIIRHNVVGALGVAVPTNSVAEAGARTRTEMTILFAVISGIVFMIGLFVARLITAPILILVKACQMVASGHFEEQVSVKSKDETGVLAHTFNHMVSGLKERDFIRDTFGKYMSEAVSEAILSGDLKLGGERKQVTILTSDIRSFTTLSETMEPEDLVAFLNSYFQSMVDCIVRYEGVVDKFIGDAIVGVFGAPIAHEDDARRAVLVALEMRKHMIEFNRYLEEGGHMPIRIGIGVHTGPVIAGNIGSEVRMEYTVIGDTVDSTDHTQSLTKTYRTDILVSTTTYELVKDYFAFAGPEVGELHGEPSPIYPLIGLREGYEELISDQDPVLAEQSPVTQEVVDAQLAAR